MDIPQDQLPQCWSDDVRMNALFAPFRLKAANPESWEMKIKFWSDMLRLWCRCRGNPVISASDAKVAFQRKNRTPACIDIVVEEMYRNGELVPISKYQQILHNGPEGWVRWGARLAFKAVPLAFTAVSSLLPARYAVDGDGLPKASIDSTQKFVLESDLKKRALSLLDSYPHGLERVGTIDEMMRRLEWVAGKDAFEMALGSLVETGRAILRGNIVKLAEPNHKVTQITEQDEALVKLATAETRLESDAARLSRDLSVAQSDARAALELGNRVAAKNHLRRKHKATQRLDRCTQALENVKHLLIQMRDVTHNMTIVDTYKTAAEAMKRDFKENNMSEDTVHETLEDLKEVMDTYNEIEKALGGITDEDTADLEAELKELLAKPADNGGKIEEKLPTPTKVPRKVSEREFHFDGEERILAELNDLGVEESSPPRSAKGHTPVAVAASWEKVEKASKDSEASKASRASQAWYPATSEWNNNYEIRQDDRLHPGQPLNIDFKSPPRLYAHDFQVKDHKLDRGVWLYNKDSNSNVDALAGTEYCSSESPGKTGGTFQMAPGGERRRDPLSDADSRTDLTTDPTTDPPSDQFEDLERRLKNLRGFRL